MKTVILHLCNFSKPSQDEALCGKDCGFFVSIKYYICSKDLPDYTELCQECPKHPDYPLLLLGNL